jgi:hypothetical protein
MHASYCRNIRAATFSNGVCKCLKNGGERWSVSKILGNSTVCPGVQNLLVIIHSFTRPHKTAEGCCMLFHEYYGFGKTLVAPVSVVGQHSQFLCESLRPLSSNS